MAASAIPKPTLPSGGTATHYFTTLAQARQALAQPSDILGQAVRFAAGKGYYLGADPKPTAAPATTTAAPAAGYATLTPAQILSAATQNVNQVVNPQLAGLATQAKTQAVNDQNLINGYTNNAVQQVKAIDFGAPYQQAAQDQNAVNTALLASLVGQGSSVQNELAGILGGSVAAPVVAGVSGQVAQNTQGAGNANLAKGDATLSQILSEGAAAKNYGNQLPALEALAGQQDTAKAQGAINQNLQTAVTDLRSKIPGLVQSEASSLASQQARAATLANTQAYQQTQTDEKYAALAMNKYIADLASNNKVQAQKDLDSYRAAEVQLGQDRIQAGRQETAARIQSQQNIAATKAAAAANKQPTAQQINKLIDQWKNGVTKNTSQTVRESNPDSNGNPVYRTITKPQTTGQLRYIQAYQKLRAMHVPDPQARQYLDSAYRRGEQGRAWLTNDEQTVLRRNQAVSASAHIYNGNVAYLDRAQAALLKKANKLPPGQWIQGSTKTKDLGPIYVITQGFS